MRHPKLSEMLEKLRLYFTQLYSEARNRARLRYRPISRIESRGDREGK